ncbi:PAS domain S-box protein [Fulvivirga sp. M361]|uniref:PAS domain S-box protein n=1 Tax=Fulvivirga sp. M361 TaxID=2594266 RepID=UPI00117B0B01|nr:PAS domain S-box protein [Fulvivirga sp. M361]TRX57719.1 PAS domain S-box protein [Fulvivirga sp. M361]
MRVFPYKILKAEEVRHINQSMAQLHVQINNAIEFVEGIERGERDIQLTNNNGEANPLIESLIKMHHKMMETSEAEKQRNWTSDGLAKFADILRDNYESLEDFSTKVISSLVKYVKANQGSIFILNEEEPENPFLELMGCYAYDRKKYVGKKIAIGQGLAGQAFLENEYLYLKEIPDEYVNITSGLGEAKPDTLLVSPLTVNDKSYGVIELATFEHFDQHEIDFVRKVGENIAATISNIKTSARTKHLLEESQQMSEELMAQEEEMRQNMEELQATQEAMTRSEARTRMIFDNAIDAIITVDSKGLVDQFNPAAEEMFGYSSDEVFGQSIKKILEAEDFYNREDKLTAEAREISGIKNNGNTFPVEVRISQSQIGAAKVFILFLRDITIKKQQDNLLKESEAKARSYFQSSVDAIITTDENGRIIDSNPASTQIFGFDQTQMKSNHFNDIIQGVDLKAPEVYLNKKRKVKGVNDQGTSFKTEMYLTSAVVGNEKLFIIYIRDILNELKKDRELAKSMMQMDQLKKDLLVKEEKSRSYFENSIDAILHITSDGSILDFNQAARDLFKITGENDVPDNFNQLILNVDIKNCPTYLNAKRKVKAKDVTGGIFKTELYLTEVFINHKAVFLAYVRDISQELKKDKEIARNLMQLDEMKIEIRNLKNQSEAS